MDCLFCKLIKENLIKKINENEYAVAFLDISQTTKGHTLVVPKKHFKNIFDIDNKYLEQTIILAKETSLLLKDKLNLKGINIVSNNEKEAGQVIDHFHIHLIPRYNELDTFDINFTNNNEIVNLDDVYKEIKI